jgi:hypothetical protein
MARLAAAGEVVGDKCCRLCGGYLESMPAEIGRPAHYGCPRCKKVYTWEVNYMVECPNPLGHLLSPPKWVTRKYEKPTPPLRAHDLTRKVTSDRSGKS